MIDTAEFQLFKMHRDHRRLLQAARFSRADSDDPTKELAGFAEHQAAARLRAMGYHVVRRGYNARFDLWVNGARVEVKASSWSSGRYQAHLRNHEADIVLWAVLTPQGDLVWYVVPQWALEGRANVAIWSQDPARYTGQWGEYENAWWWLDAACQRASHTAGDQMLLLKEVEL